MRISRTVVGMLLAGALAIALGAFVLLRGTSSADVLDDAGASADDIIDVAGPPFAVARSGDGSLLLSFAIRDEEGGEAQKGAWRVLGPDGSVVRSARTPAYSEPHGLADGFVLVPRDGAGPTIRIAGDGTSTPTGAVQPATDVRAGDVLLTDYGLLTSYRPSDGSVHELPPPPASRAGDDVFEKIAVDDDGTVWGVTGWTDDEATLVHSADGGRTWRTDQVAMPKGAAAGSLLSSHGVTLLSFISGMSDKIVGATIVDGGAPRPFAPDGLRLRGLDHVKTVVLPDGRLVLGEDDTRGPAGWFVATSAANDAFEPLDVPARTTSITATGGALYAVTTPSDSGGLWQSLDDGATWAKVDLDGR